MFDSRSIAGVMLAFVVACSSSPSKSDQIEDQERAALAPLKAKYPDVVMGYDFHGPSVDISVDLNAMTSMDEPVEDAMKAQALRDWKSAWVTAHPGQHGVLTVRILDFRGNQESKESTRV
jgi:hypothetical protein